MPKKGERPIGVKIGAHQFRIEYVPKIFESEDLGRTDHNAGLILILDNLALAMELDTLLHEVLHAIWYVSGLHQNKDLEEEMFVSILSPWIIMLLNDPQNKEFLKYIKQ